LPFEEDGGERGEGEFEGEGLIHPGDGGGVEAAGVAGVGAAVMGGIGVEKFAVEAFEGNADAVMAADDGSAIEDDEDEVAGVAAAAEEGENAVIGVGAVHPLKAGPIGIELMESGLGGIETVESGGEMLHAEMAMVAEEIPFEGSGFGPFGALGDFAAHEKEFFAGVGELPGEKEAQAGELLPHVAGHFMEEGAFAVDDFVVGEGQEEIFREGVEEGEGEFVLVEFAVDGVGGEVFEGVVHPAHVPFEGEAEAAEVGGAGNAGEGGGLFGDGEDAGKAGVGDFVEVF